MKKLISIFTGISLLTGAGLNTISCGGSGKGEIQFITDGGSLVDKSFNQQGWEAVINFAKKNNKTFANKQPANKDDKKLFTDAYNAAFKSNAKIIVTNGAYHNPQITEFAKQNPDKWVIFSDDQYIQPFSHAKASSLTYSAEQSGFLAGIASAVYLHIEHKKYYDDNQFNIGSFGGGDIPAVTCFMAGFEASAIWWSSMVTKDPDRLSQIIKKLSGDENYNWGVKEVTDVTANESKNAITSFGTTDGLAETATDFLVDNQKVDVLMPVAGPQTNNVLNHLKEKTSANNIKIIGVDTDQAQLYPNYKDRFITSALKKVQPAITKALEIWHSGTQSEKEDWFSGKTKNLGSEWIEIAANVFADDKIKYLNTELKREVALVSEWWEKDVLDVMNKIQSKSSTFEVYNDAFKNLKTKLEIE